LLICIDYTGSTNFLPQQDELMAMQTQISVSEIRAAAASCGQSLTCKNLTSNESQLVRTAEGELEAIAWELARVVLTLVFRTNFGFVPPGSLAATNEQGNK
jgi:hypothetical protein